jgi:hypothetical protein
MPHERAELKFIQTTIGVAITPNPWPDSDLSEVSIFRWLCKVTAVLFEQGREGTLAMIEIIILFFGLFSAGIFLAHAFDGYRTRAWLRERDHA